MITKGIRGAITVEENSADAIKSATLELVSTIMNKNNLKIEDISHIIFTLTNDLNAAFPAKFARTDMGFSEIAMMCFHELDVPDSLVKCLRILVVVNCDENFKPQFVYLKGASRLRK